MEYNKLTKADLLSAVATLEQQKTQLAAESAYNANLANWFQKVLESLEQVLIDSPFVDTKGKFFKKLFWVISNFSKLREFVETIASHIKVWRQDVEKIREAIKNNQPIPQPTN